jgi:hypothetical protein
MLGFVAKAFRGWMNFILWLVLIICAIGGAILASARHSIWDGDSSFNFSGKTFVGFLIGTFVGLIIDILWGGYVANFLNMVDNIERQEKYFKLILKNRNIKIPNENSNVSNGKFNSFLQDLQKPIEKRTVNSKETIYENNEIKNKICNNCGKEISIDLDKCNNCGCNDFSQI